MTTLTALQFVVLIFCVFIFSMMIGGYYGTIDYRIRNDLPLVTLNCYCPSCGHKLSQLHQIPIFSWIALRGRCFYCKTRIPARYPLLESAFVLYYLGTFLLFQDTPLAFLLL